MNVTVQMDTLLPVTDMGAMVGRYAEILRRGIICDNDVTGMCAYANYMKYTTIVVPHCCCAIL